MKRIIAVCSLLTLFAMGAIAQPGQGRDTTGQAQRMKDMRDRQKAGLMDQAKLTNDEADKVLDIQMANMGNRRGWRDLSEDDRKKKMDEMKTDSEKRYKAAGLSDEKIKAVNAYFEAQGRGRGMGGPRPMPAPGTPPPPPQK